MATEPIGRIDHIGIAVKSIAAARPFFEDVLGARFRRENDHPSGDFRIAIFDLHEFCIELLGQSLGPLNNRPYWE
jgi:catechol 2,3-dioxygenase-like lactoylglutathione lyase family enzyme